MRGLGQDRHELEAAKVRAEARESEERREADRQRHKVELLTSELESTRHRYHRDNRDDWPQQLSEVHLN